MYYTYVLHSNLSQEFYIGSTSNLKQRIKQHNREKENHKLIFYEAFLDKSDSRRREIYFKTTKGKRVIRLMLRNYFNN